MIQLQLPNQRRVSYVYGLRYGNKRSVQGLSTLPSFEGLSEVSMYQGFKPPMALRELLLESLGSFPHESDMVMHVHFAPALVMYVSMVQTGSDPLAQRRFLENTGHRHDIKRCETFGAKGLLQPFQSLALDFVELMPCFKLPLP